MAGTNDFKAFATDANANVTSQEEWETLTALKKGFSSGKASSAQVSKALRQPSTMAAVLGQFIANAELDALDDGDVDGLVAKLATAITTNLGLGEGAPAIGVPFFWPSAAMPNTVIDSWSSMVFLKFNGAKFSATDYPVLAKVFPALALPDARGDFIRVWDDGRGVDGGRELLSWQNATNFSQFAGNIGEGAGHAINFHDGIAGNQPGFSRFNFTSNSVGDGVNFVAVRPRNIAFNFLVRAK
ncbi:phage tail protein [Shigella sonnei]|uniref:phage tail protein n=1 Tax=Enterobacteriaceae TaxID=543 RepID=UPI000B9575A2|nr:MULTISPECIES: phage tail protein [Enterobacteriaceae]OYL60577.1 phage tail protein [Shigella sonnei]HAU9441039.1 phage tail protein [Escherichia coli]